MNFPFARLLTFFGLILGLSACDDIENDITQIRQDGFVYCSPGGFVTLNPQLNEAGVVNSSIAPQVFDTLVTLDKSGSPQPNLATSWQVSADGLTYTFNLRKNVWFHTTLWFTPLRAFNASDVAFSFNRMLDSNNPFYYVNQGHYPVFESSGLPQLIKSIKVLDDYQIQFQLNQASQAFLANLSASFAVIHSQEYAAQLEKSGQKRLIDTQPVGTGPYQYVDNDHQRIVRLQASPTYWGENAKIKNIVFNLGRIGTGSIAQLLKNECDVIASPITSQLTLAENNENLALHMEPAMNVSYLALNTQHYALSNPKVRQAIYHAINRQTIIDAIYYGSASIADSLLPPHSWAYPAHKSQPSYQLEEAKRQLQASGIMLPLTLNLFIQSDPKTYNPSPKKTAEILQYQLAKIGIKLNIIQGKERMRRIQLSEQNADMILTGWTAANNDPDSIYRPLLSCNAYQAGLNIANWCNPEFDALLEAASQNENKATRQLQYRALYQHLRSQMPLIPLAHSLQYRVYHSSLKGFNFSPYSAGPFNQVERVY